VWVNASFVATGAASEVTFAVVKAEERFDRAGRWTRRPVRLDRFVTTSVDGGTPPVWGETEACVGVDPRGDVIEDTFDGFVFSRAGTNNSVELYSPPMSALRPSPLTGDDDDSKLAVCGVVPVRWW